MSFLRLMALFEGSSLLILLLIAVPLKRFFDIPEAVHYIGPTHGLLFLAFNLLLLQTALKKQLTFAHAGIGFLSSLIPFGTFVYKAKILSKYQQATPNA